MVSVLEKIVAILVLYAVWIALVRMGVIPAELVVMLIAGLGLGLAIIALLKAAKKLIEETIRGLPQAPAARAAPVPTAMPESHQPSAEQAWSWWFERCVSYAPNGRVRAPDANDLTRAFIVVIAGLGIMVTVSVATLGQSAFAMIGEGRVLLRREKAARAKARPAATLDKPSKSEKKGGRRGRKPAGRTREEALAILQEHARRSGGVIVGSNATLADLVGVSPSTLGDARKGWLAQWEREGVVRVVSKDRGKKVVSVTGADEKAA